MTHRSTSAASRVAGIPMWLEAELALGAVPCLLAERTICFSRLGVFTFQVLSLLSPQHALLGLQLQGSLDDF